MFNRVSGGGESIKAELLWTNPNTGISFDPQTVSIDLSKYEAVFIKFKHYYGILDTDTTPRVRKCYIVKGNTDYMFTMGTDNSIRYRTATINETGVVFGTASGGGASIPMEIYGLKKAITFEG